MIIKRSECNILWEETANFEEHCTPELEREMPANPWSPPPEGDKYFSGSRLVSEFAHEISSSSVVKVKINAAWIDPGISQTSHCGNPSKIEFEETFGLTQAESEKLDAEISSSIGLPKVAEVKGAIVSGSEYNLSLSISKRLKREFDITSDRCRSSRLKIFQKIYLIDLFFETKTFWGGLKESHCQICERTQNVDARIIVSEYEDSCGCPKDNIRPSDGSLRLFWGRLSVITPFFRSKSGFVTSLGNLEFQVDPRNVRGIAYADIEASYIPSIFRYLSQDPGETVRVGFELWSISPGLFDMPVVEITSDGALAGTVSVGPAGNHGRMWLEN